MATHLEVRGIGALTTQRRTFHGISQRVDGKMYDVANKTYVNYLLIRAEAVEKRNAEKAAAWAAAEGIV